MAKTQHPENQLWWFFLGPWEWIFLFSRIWVDFPIQFRTFEGICGILHEKNSNWSCTYVNSTFTAASLDPPYNARVVSFDKEDPKKSCSTPNVLGVHSVIHYSFRVETVCEWLDLSDGRDWYRFPIRHEEDSFLLPSWSCRRCTTLALPLPLFGVKTWVAKNSTSCLQLLLLGATFPRPRPYLPSPWHPWADCKMLDKGSVRSFTNNNHRVTHQVWTELLLTLP